MRVNLPLERKADRRVAQRSDDGFGVDLLPGAAASMAWLHKPAAPDVLAPHNTSSPRLKSEVGKRHALLRASRNFQARGWPP